MQGHRKSGPFENCLTDPYGDGLFDIKSLTPKMDTLWQTNIAGWNITIFNRVHSSSIRVPFSIAMLVYRSAIGNLSKKMCESQSGYFNREAADQLVLL